MARVRITRACMTSDHGKCLGYLDSVADRPACDCPCHEQLPTLWSELRADVA